MIDGLGIDKSKTKSRERGSLVGCSVGWFIGRVVAVGGVVRVYIYGVQTWFFFFASRSDFWPATTAPHRTAGSRDVQVRR